jgi:hypothetical protein
VVVDLPCDVALEAADRFLLGQAVLHPSIYVVAGPRIRRHPRDDDVPEGRVSLTVAASVESSFPLLTSTGLVPQRWAKLASLRELSRLRGGGTDFRRLHSEVGIGGGLRRHRWVHVETVELRRGGRSVCDGRGRARRVHRRCRQIPPTRVIGLTRAAEPDGVARHLTGQSILCGGGRRRWAGQRGDERHPTEHSRPDRQAPSAQRTLHFLAPRTGSFRRTAPITPLVSDPFAV